MLKLKNYSYKGVSLPNAVLDLTEVHISKTTQTIIGDGSIYANADEVPAVGSNNMELETIRFVIGPNENVQIPAVMEGDTIVTPAVKSPDYITAITQDPNIGPLIADIVGLGHQLFPKYSEVCKGATLVSQAPQAKKKLKKPTAGKKTALKKKGR